MKKIIVSGVQPSGNLHIGNYLGSINNWNNYDDYESLFFLADLHAITVNIDKDKLSNSILSTAALYIACGIDPEKNIIFKQSDSYYHSYLAWILNCITPNGWLKRMTQFKEKAGKKQDLASAGLYTYPLLMAADILLYNADIVPVGEDQKQHLELARDVAGVLNRKIDQLNDDNLRYITIPEPKISGSAIRIMSLKNGLEKMSKSNPSDQSRINLIDDVDLIRKKILKSTTDSINDIYFDKENRPEISNLINIFAAVTDKKITDIESEYKNSGFAKFKNALADSVIAKIQPITDKYNDLMKNKDYIINVLDDGAKRANVIAKPNIDNIRNIFGFNML